MRFAQQWNRERPYLESIVRFGLGS
jgi:hypothetical protein